MVWIFIFGARIMKTSQWRRAVENRCVFNARLKALSDRSGDHSAGGRRFYVAGPLTAKLRCPVAAADVLLKSGFRVDCVVDI